MHELNEPEDIATLRDGTIFESLPNCRWPQRYAGKQWRKHGIGVTAIGPEAARSTTPIAYFRDPLPATVLGHAKFQTMEVHTLPGCLPEHTQQTFSDVVE